MLFRERKQLVIYVAAAVIVGGFVLFRYLPLRKSKNAFEQAKAAQTLAIAKASAQGQQLPALKEQLLTLQQAVADYEVNIPPQRSLGEFLHEIADLMNEHDLTEQVVQPGKEVEAKGLSCILINMQCKGKLKHIFEFFSSLQMLDRLVRIEQVKLGNDKDFNGEVTMGTKAFIYYKGQSGQG